MFGGGSIGPLARAAATAAANSFALSDGTLACHAASMRATASCSALRLARFDFECLATFTSLLPGAAGGRTLSPQSDPSSANMRI